MNKQKLKKRAKRFFIAAIVIGMIMFVVAAVHWLFLIPSAIFFGMAFLVFKDIRAIGEDEYEVQEVVNDNLETKQINQEVNKVETTNEEKAELLDILSKDEDVNLFLKVEKGKIKLAVFEKLNKEFEAKLKKEAAEVKPKAEAEKGSKGEEDIIVED